MYMTKQIAYDASKDTKYHSELLNAMLRYINDDWGDLCEDDKAMNKEASKNGGRILAAYNTSRGKIYIITDGVKSITPTTTVLYANEY